jgi:hypothetical protein
MHTPTDKVIMLVGVWCITPLNRIAEAMSMTHQGDLAFKKCSLCGCMLHRLLMCKWACAPQQTYHVLVMLSAGSTAVTWLPPVTWLPRLQNV